VKDRNLEAHRPARGAPAGRIALGALLVAAAAGPAFGAQRIVYQEDRSIRVLEGSECKFFNGSSSTESGAQAEFAGQIAFPKWATRANVVLNGFQATYAHDDHHVKVLDFFVDEVAFKRNVLTWRAGATFEDKNGDDAVTLCYTWVAFGWSKQKIDADVIQGSAIRDLGDTNGDGTPENDRRTSIRYEIADPRAPIAVLPRSLSLAYADTDHHVLQIAYGYGQDLETPDAPRKRRFEVHGILKDNDGRTPRFTAETSVVEGRGVRLVHEPFPIRPADDCGWFEGCIGDGNTRDRLRSDRVTVRGVAGDFVIPILSGLNIDYEFDDEHVRTAGAFLNQIQFDPATRDLHYTVNTVLLDKNGDPPFSAEYNVTLLILNERGSPWE
jgi:hypothetical protein